MYLDVVHEAGVTSILQRVLVVGVGGLGCPVAFALARAGVSELTLMDPDVVDLSNLHRQPLHRRTDVGRPKVHSAADSLQRAFPVKIRSLQERLHAENVEQHFREHQLVVDATDHIETKFLLSDAAVFTSVPLVYGGVIRLEGLAMRIDPDGPCLRCLFEDPPDDALTCAQAGILGTMAGVVGELQAALALRGPHAPGETMLEVVDGRALTFRAVRVRRRADCAACSDGGKSVWTGRMKRVEA